MVVTGFKSGVLSTRQRRDDMDNNLLKGIILEQLQLISRVNIVPRNYVFE